MREPCHGAGLPNEVPGPRCPLQSGDSGPGAHPIGLSYPPCSRDERRRLAVPTSSRRNVPVDRNNWAPRLGFAYQLTSNTVVRGGAGVYYGMNVATNYQYPGTAFRKDGVVYFTKDNFQTQVRHLGESVPSGFACATGHQVRPTGN